MKSFILAIVISFSLGMSAYADHGIKSYRYGNTVGGSHPVASGHTYGSSNQNRFGYNNTYRYGGQARIYYQPQVFWFPQGTYYGVGGYYNPYNRSVQFGVNSGFYNIPQVNSFNFPHSSHFFPRR